MLHIFGDVGARLIVSILGPLTLVTKATIYAL
jgi:hypothetical protein